MMKRKNEELTLMQRIALESLWLLARGFAVLPYWFKYYVVEDLLYLLLYYCLRYRRKVVAGNLARSFPEKSERERAAIARKFYRTLAEIFVDTLNMAHMTPRKVRRLLQVEGSAELMAQTDNRDWIALMAHYGCWEYGFYWGRFAPANMLVAVYHPLENRVFEHLYRRLRTSESAMTVPMKECLRFYLRHRDSGVNGKRMTLALIADQNPPRRPGSHWFRFLNQDTIFFDGGEKLALRCGLPVYYVWLDRVQRGRYVMRVEPLYDGVERVDEHEITERYVRRLEQTIQLRPELWMWSHRRWKHKRTDVKR